MKLKPKQEMFCREYLIDLNATKAAIRAGYSKKTANEQGSQMLAIDYIAARIQQLMTERAQEVGVTASDVLRELLLIAKTDLGQAYDDEGHLKPIHEIPEDIRRAIAGIKVFDEFEGFGKDRVKVGEVREVKFWDKPKALELLGRHLKLFTDKVEHTGDDGGPLVILTMPANGSEAPEESDDGGN